MKKIILRIRNIFHNWWYGIKPLNCSGCLNVGVTKDGHIVRVNWTKEFNYVSRKYEQ